MFHARPLAMPRWLLRLAMALAGAACASTILAATPDAAASLRAKYAATSEQLQRNQFGRPLVLESADTANRLTGDIYAVVGYAFGDVQTGLSDPAHWCDVMSLHINTKYCRPVADPAGTLLRVHVGKKTPEELKDAARVDFRYRATAATPEYFGISLNAAEGPMGTSDYRIELESIPLTDKTSFLHLRYSYSFNMAGRLAMQTYLKTLARDKVGFTATGKSGDGEGPQYVGGMRGLVERNAMRYYLAIDAFLEAGSTAPAARFEKRLQSWFTAVERYPRQLHEMDLADYLRMKRAENLRQQTVY